MSDALVSFRKLYGWVDQLAEIHGKVQAGRGRRHRQEALHRASVVMSIAAWESYIEDVLNEAVAALDPGAQASHGERTSWALARTAAAHAANRLHAPDAKNVTGLLETHLGLNPSPHWAVTANRVTYTPPAATKRLNEWLRIRHAVAHGRELPADLTWIQGPSGKPRLTLSLMLDCRRFLEALVLATDDAVADHLVAYFGLGARPW